MWSFGTSYWCIHRGIDADKQATQVLPFTLSIGTITLLRSAQNSKYVDFYKWFITM